MARGLQHGESFLMKSDIRNPPHGSTATQEALNETDALSQPDLAKLTLGAKTFPLKHVKSGLLDSSGMVWWTVRHELRVRGGRE